MERTRTARTRHLAHAAPRGALACLLAAALALSLGGLPAAYGAEAGDGSGVGAPSDVGADAASVGGPDATYGVAQGIGSATDPETPVLVDIAAPPAPASAAGVMPLGAVVAAQVTDSASGLVFDVRDSSAWCGAGAYVTGYEGSSASVSVPATLGGQPVVYVSLASLPREGLTSLNVSACSGSLKYLYCGSDSLGNSLVSLNVSGCAALVELDCRFSRSLASLDVSDCASLERLTCHEVGLASLDVGGLTALESLFCYKVGLSSLNVSGCASLKSLVCWNSRLTSLDLSGLGALVDLDCPYNYSLTFLNVSGCTALESLNCRDSRLASLDVSSNVVLTELECRYGRITDTSVLVSRFGAASVLPQVQVKDGLVFEVRGIGDDGARYGSGAYVTNYEGTAASASVPAELGGQPVVSVSLSSNVLTSLDMTRCVALKYLSCSGNLLTSLDASGCTALENLYCFMTGGLTRLDASGCSALEDLSCYDGALTFLDVSGCTVLESLRCSYNDLAVIDVSESAKLRYLDCSDNLLTTLDVGRNAALEELYCYGNLLTSLGMDGAVSLKRLNCSGNLLTRLDVSRNAQLAWLSCSNNRLASLDVGGNAKLSWLNCSYNRIPDSAARRALIARFGESRVLPQDESAPVPFSVSFDSRRGSAVAGRTVTAGSAVGVLPAPKRTGHAFLGWYTAPSGGARVAASTTVTANVTYYAQWRANTYMVRLDANGGKVSGKAASSVRRSYGSALGRLATPVRTGYTFQGWYTGKVKGTRVGAATKVSKAATYYAHWKAKGPVVTLNANGGKVGKAATASVVKAKGKAIGRLATPTRAGYSFLGWYTGKAKGTKVTAKTKATKNVTLYAHWKAKGPVVTLDANGGRVGKAAKASVVRTKGKAVGRLLAPTRTGYAFQGWYTGKVKGTKVTTVTKVTKSVTLYAHWKRAG